MLEEFSREELLIGKDAIEKLQNSKVVIFGIGGVGSYVVEGLVRAGVGKVVLVDNDNVSISNINRQIIATQETIGKAKVEVAKERILNINPKCQVETINEFFMPNSKDFFNDSIDYVVDCVDTVTAKIEIIERAQKHNVRLVDGEEFPTYGCIKAGGPIWVVDAVVVLFVAIYTLLTRKNNKINVLSSTPLITCDLE